MCPKISSGRTATECFAITCQSAGNGKKPAKTIARRPTSVRFATPSKFFGPRARKTPTRSTASACQFLRLGGGDGLPDGVDHYLKLVTGRMLIIPTDNDAPGRKHGQEKAKRAHSLRRRTHPHFRSQGGMAGVPRGRGHHRLVREGRRNTRQAS